MYTIQEGYKIVIFHTARNKEYKFTQLGSRSYVENELKDLGFSPLDIAAATFTAMNSDEIKEKILILNAAWDNY